MTDSFEYDTDEIVGIPEIIFRRADIQRIKAFANDFADFLEERDLCEADATASFLFFIHTQANEMDDECRKRWLGSCVAILLGRFQIEGEVH